MDIILKILIINLKKSSERKIRMSKQLDDLGMQYEFLEATEGKTLTDEWIENNIGDRLKNTFYNNLHFSVNKNALACAQSHRKAQLVAASFECGYTLILEDDVELSRNFREKIMETLNLMQEHSINIAFPGYNWFNGSHEKLLDVNSFGSNYSFFKYPVDGRVTGAYAYIVNSTGAKKLVQDNLDKIQDTADSFYIKEKGLLKSTVVLYPKIVTVGYYDSEIGYSESNIGYLRSCTKIFKKGVYSLALKSKTIYIPLRYLKERRW